MTSKSIVALISIVAVLALANAAYSDCGMCGTCGVMDKAADKADDQIINTVCPVMGGEVSPDTEYKVVYEGKAIGFCCEGCINTFNEDPEKYFEKVMDEVEELEEAE